jgi:hypothetical protein
VWAAQIPFNLLPGADPNTSLVVVNVAGAVDGSFNLTNAVINLNGLPAANVIWNVCDAGAVGFTNIQFRGSLLAPFSALSLGYVLLCRVCRVVCGSLIACFCAEMCKLRVRSWQQPWPAPASSRSRRPSPASSARPERPSRSGSSPPFLPHTHIYSHFHFSSNYNPIT